MIFLVKMERKFAEQDMNANVKHPINQSTNKDPL
jgi:hypothetical protein